MIRVALPNKGQLFEPTLDLMKACGYRASKSLKSLTSADPENGVEFYFLRPSDIPMYVGRGIIELGITGIDFVAESGSPCSTVLNLPFGHSKHCAAVPVASPYQKLDELCSLRIATSFPRIVGNYFGNKTPQLVELEGAVEISVSLGVADAVVDVVETGSTLKQAGLRILGEPLFRSQAALVSHPGKENLPEVITMRRRLEGKLVALSYMMIEYDVPANLLDQACAITPGLDAPTVSNLHKRDWCAVKAMVRKEEANRIMDQLWNMGCRSILLSAMETARI